METDWDWVTNEAFESELEDILIHRISIHEILSIPGVMEILREEYNNLVLESLAEKGGRDPDSGLSLFPRFIPDNKNKD